MFKRIATAGLVLGLTAAAPPALASNCAPRDAVIERLSGKYSEKLTGGGLQGSASGQALIEVWASDSTGTFTVIVTTAQGFSCIVAAGTNWMQNNEVSTVDEKDS